MGSYYDEYHSGSVYAILNLRKGRGVENSYMACNMQKGTFRHLCKVSSRISLLYPRRLIRDDTLRPPLDLY